MGSNLDPEIIDKLWILGEYLKLSVLYFPQIEFGIKIAHIFHGFFVSLKCHLVHTN